MPRRQPTPCTADPRCPRLVDSPGPCPEHAAERNRVRAARESWRDYGREWRAIRAAVLAAHPACQECGRPAVDVDHRLPLRHGGTHAPENLAALCRSCHARKTARENGFGGRRD
jgi:5-methylcytosine-specific restriction enzyme A